MVRGAGDVPGGRGEGVRPVAGREGGGVRPGGGQGGEGARAAGAVRAVTPRRWGRLAIEGDTFTVTVGLEEEALEEASLPARPH